MSNRRPAGAYRVLALDGGGMRGLSLVLLLKELMLQVSIQNKLNFVPEPWQCFDFVCGTSTGGLVAILIGRLGKTLQECEVLFRDFGSKIFSEGKPSQKLRLTFKGSKHTSRGLEEVIEQQAGEQNMYDGSTLPGGHLPTAVVAVAKTTTVPGLFRTYGVRANRERVSVLQACRATTAATMFFDSTTVNGITYVDGGFGENNPSELVLSELEDPEGPFEKMTDAVKELGCLVSLGTGRSTYNYDRPGVAAYVKPKGIQSAEDAIGLLKAIATDCHKTHLSVETRFIRENALDKYFRLDVTRGLEAVQLNEADDIALQQISSATTAYIRENKAYIAKCAEKIKPRNSGNRAEHVDIETSAKRALASNENRYGADHPNTIDALMILARVYSQSGRLPEQEAAYLRAFHARERTLGLDNRSTLDTAFNLAVTYEEEDKLDEAETAFLQALSGYERTIGGDDIQTLQTLNNLGNVCAAKHDYTRAEDFYNRALEGRIRVLGADHQDTLGTLYNMGRSYTDQARYSEAEEMFHRSYRGYERTVGPNHELSIRSLNSKARLYAKSGRVAEAGTLLRDVLTRQDASGGPNDISTIRTLYNLGILYRDDNDMANAEIFFIRAVDRTRNVINSGCVVVQRLGNHAMLDAANDLACIYERQGRLADAQALFREALALKETALGPGHPSTIGTMRNLQRVTAVGDIS